MSSSWTISPLAIARTSRITTGPDQFIEGRVEETDLVHRAIVDVELVFHLAASVGVFEILRDPLHALRSNLAASDTLFTVAAEHGVRTVFTSTSEVYGKNNANGLRESDDSVFGPTSVSRWLYGVSKAADEFMALAHHGDSGLPISVVRLFNTTGPRQTGAYGMVVPRFVRQAVEGGPITVFGSGNQTRCSRMCSTSFGAYAPGRDTRGSWRGDQRRSAGRDLDRRPR